MSTKKIVAGVLASAVAVSSTAIPVSSVPYRDTSFMSGIANFSFRTLQLKNKIFDAVMKGVLTPAEARELTSCLNDSAKLSETILAGEKKAQDSVTSARENVVAMVNENVKKAQEEGVAGNPIPIKAATKLFANAKGMLDPKMVETSARQLFEAITDCIDKSFGEKDPINIAFLVDVVETLLSFSTLSPELSQRLQKLVDTFASYGSYKVDFTSILNNVDRATKDGLSSSTEAENAAKAVLLSTLHINFEMFANASGMKPAYIATGKAELEKQANRLYNQTMSSDFNQFKAEYRSANAKLKFFNELERIAGVRDRKPE